MKKVIKSLSILFLSLTLVVGSFCYVQNTKADDKVSEWKHNAILTPAAGSLVGAGYIDVKVDTSLEGYKYSVLLDGQQMFWKGNSIVKTELGEDTTGAVVKDLESNGGTTKTEVYTTTVSSHTLSVIAFKSGEQIFSDELTFYVSKKGLAMGDNMGTKVKLSKLNCSWYYNWGTKAFNNSVDSGVQHIPMMWGGYDDSREDMQNLSTTANYILGFNEPDIGSQANMGFWEGIDVWNQYIAPLKMRKVSPAPAAPGGNSGWLKDFMNGNTICQLSDGTWDYYSYYSDNPDIKPVVKDGVDNSNVDAVCLHYYMNTINLDGIFSAVNNLWNQYHKPIWVTEIGLFGVKGLDNDFSYEATTNRKKIQSYLKSIVERFDQLEYVERYCWFPYDVESENAIDGFNGSGGTSMFEYATGLYTELGEMYSSIGNPEGYSGGTISNDEKFDWNNRVKTDIEFNKYKDELKVSWSKGSLTNLYRVDVYIDEQLTSICNGDTISTSNLNDGKHTVEFVLYDNNNLEIIRKSRGFRIDRASLPTTETPTETSTVAPSGVKPTFKPTVNKPGKTVIKAKNIKKKSVKLSWNKVSTANKYKVQWSLNKTFTKKTKNKIVTNQTIGIKKLKKRKIYFFRVAAMNSAGLGPWSNVKKIKIKK